MARLAGFIVSQVAEEMPDKIEKLVFIATMIPYEGKTVFDIISADPESRLLQNLIFAEDKSWATVNEETLKNALLCSILFAICSPKQAA